MAPSTLDGSESTLRMHACATAPKRVDDDLCIDCLSYPEQADYTPEETMCSEEEEDAFDLSIDSLSLEASEQQDCSPQPLCGLPSPSLLPQSLFPCSDWRGTCSAHMAGTVLVVGVGYVGTHLAERFSAEYSVVAFDISQKRCATLKEHFADNINVHVTHDLLDGQHSCDFDLILVSVPTLLQKDNKVDTTHIQAAVELVAGHTRPGTTVVVESSVTIGMTRSLMSRLHKDLGIFVGFSPERVDPGRVYPTFQDIPKVVSGIDDASLAEVIRLYSRVFRHVVPVSSLETAEMTKLYENCQRLLLIAYTNEMADACEAHGISTEEVCRASATKPFGFTPFNPSLGAGGHCIPVNPSYLLSNCDMPLLAQAAADNRERPVRKSKQVAAVAKSAWHRRRLGDQILSREPAVLIVGMGFKKGEASLAYAPTAILAERLCDHGISVTYLDDLVNTSRWKSLRRYQATTDRLDGDFDVIVVTQTPDVELQKVLDNLKLAEVLYFALHF